MTQDDLISVDRVSKCFRIYRKPSDALTEFVLRRSRSDQFWALRDVSFRLGHKQRLGIVGANGSGKSTLLRVITGNLPPTNGAVTVRGRLSAVLSLNSVLKPDETAYENIRFNLLLHGCPPRQVEDKVEDILDFAELGPFAYKPVKTFSTGMGARLAFGIATSLDPEILIVDEVLSVGDAYFTAKAVKRMRAMCDKGKALLFVSHALADVRRLCDTVLWLEHGTVRAYGPAGEVLSRYEEDARRQEDEQLRSGNAAARDAQFAAQAEEAAQGVTRFRLVTATTAPKVGATYYVRRLTVHGADGAEADARPAADAAAGADGWARIDPIGCEWGRLYQRHGSDCRLLYPQTGRTPGGMILVQKPGPAGSPYPVRLAIELAGEDESSPPPAFQQFDVRTADWVTLPTAREAAGRDGWATYVAQAELPAVDDRTLPTLLARIEERARPDVEIRRVYVRTAGEERGVVVEWDPFDVVVEMEAHREVPLLDVGLKISRDDGLYVFWQSSGQVGPNLENVRGPVRVTFHFDPNCVGPGTYDLTVTCGNGWDLDDNYPYSRVYARVTGAAQFRVANRDARLDLGQISTLVPVTVEAMEAAGATRQVA